MGYYSFYKIIKDIFQTILGRKFFRLLLILAIVLCLCSLSNKVFATEYPSDLPEAPLPDENYICNHYIIAKTTSGTIRCYTFYTISDYNQTDTLNFSYLKKDDGTYWLSYICEDGYGHYGVYYVLEDESWVLTKEASNISNHTEFLNTQYLEEILYSTNDVINTETGEIYFSSSSQSTPYFSNADDMLDYDFNNMYINMGSSDVDDVIYLHKLEVDRTFEDDTGVIYYKQGVWLLDSDSDYYGISNDLVSYYSIPRSALSISSDKEYLFVLNDNASSINATNGLYSDSSAYDILHLEPSNSIITPEQEQNDAIKGNTDAINNLENTITSNEYDENQIQIDGSLSDNIDEDSYTNFITEIINSINNAITCDWNTVETVEIPLGFVDESITWKSDLLSAHVPQSLKLIINTFWMFLFGFYIFKFSLNLVNWLKSGEILDGKGFNSDEVITSNML